MKPVLVLRHEPDVSMGSLTGVLAEAGLEPRQLDLFQRMPDDLPWSDSAGLIVLGGTMSANDGDKFPFLVAELQWLSEAVPRNVPTLGICLGAQLLAKALGAEVYRSPVSEIGWFQIELCPPLPKTVCLAGGTRGDRFPLAPRHVRPARRRGPPGAKPALPAAGVPHGRIGLWTAIPCRDGSRADGAVAERVPRITICMYPLRCRRGRDSLDAAAAFPVMNPFTQCVLRRFAELCRQKR